MKNDLGKTKLSISRRDFILHASALSGSFGVIANANHAVARPFDDVVASGILRVALYAENPPFSEVIDGSPVGIDVDLARVVAERLGLEIKITIVDAAENVDGDLRMNLTRGDLAGSRICCSTFHTTWISLYGTIWFSRQLHISSRSWAGFMTPASSTS
jgi:polar amino acid transport system substrate-binding protein